MKRLDSSRPHRKLKPSHHQQLSGKEGEYDEKYILFGFKHVDSEENPGVASHNCMKTAFVRRRSETKLLLYEITMRVFRTDHWDKLEAHK